MDHFNYINSVHLRECHFDRIHHRVQVVSTGNKKLPYVIEFLISYVLLGLMAKNHIFT